MIRSTLDALVCGLGWELHQPGKAGDQLDQIKPGKTSKTPSSFILFVFFLSSTNLQQRSTIYIVRSINHISQREIWHISFLMTTNRYIQFNRIAVWINEAACSPLNNELHSLEVLLIFQKQRHVKYWHVHWAVWVKHLRNTRPTRNA